MVFTNVYNPRSLIERTHEHRKTDIKRGATAGSSGTIVGDCAFVGAESVINKDVASWPLDGRLMAA
ncbi:MAG: hypothetical protein JNN21_14295 [Candidatus Accumulibacter sp.]|nr:hypothetical protein [Accumulibacter sp.]